MTDGTSITVLSSNGVAAVLKQLGPDFERASGHRLEVRYGATGVLKQAIDDGAPFDLAILAASAMAALEAAGIVAVGSRVALARSGIGVAARAGAPKPDIATVEALKHALLGARSVAYSTEGVSGIHLARVLERLGIADAVNARAKLRTSGPTAELVASGEAELAVQQVSELLPVAGVALVGPLPPELQLTTIFELGIAAGAREAEAAGALARFLTAPDRLPVILGKGMESG